MSLGNLHIRERQDGGWDLSLATDRTVATGWSVSAAEVGELRRAAATLLRAPGAALASDDAALGAAESTFGRQLGGLVFADPAIAHRLGQLSGRGANALLVEGADDLPWELIEVGHSGRPLEDEGMPVVRRVPGPAWALRPPGAGAAIWQVGLDPTTRQLARDLNLPCAVNLDDLGGVGLLLVGAHGAGSHLRRNGGGVGIAGLSASLQDHPAALVLLLACDTGGAGGLAERLIGAGVPAVLAPAARVPREVARVAGAAAATDPARSPLAIARAARRAVRALALPLPAGRWWQWRLSIADPAALGATAAPAAIPGWPRPSTEGALLLAHVGECGARLGLLGLEAVLEALGGPQAHRLLPSLRERLLLLHPHAGARRPPRLERLGQVLPELFTPDDLRRALTAELPDWLDSWDGVRTLQSAPGRAGEGLATGMEVVGGPDDGLRLHPSPGQTVGRFDREGGPDLAIYLDTPLVDPRLSRHHLTWLEAGRIRLERPASRIVAGRRVQVEVGGLDLAVGTLLELSHGTLVRGIV